MNRWSRVRRAWPAGVVALVAGAVLIAAWTASAAILQTTDQPLPGSQFQGADGNQDDVAGLIDWQGLQASGRVQHTSDPNAQDDVFTGGDKELVPNDWGLTTQNDGATPGSANIFDAYRSTERAPDGDAFLYLGFTREAANGTVFGTFELNQDARLWTNSTGTKIPCRTTGDILITFDPHGNDAEVLVERWVTDHVSSTPPCAKDGHLDSATFSSSEVQASFNNDTAAIRNFLPGHYPTGAGAIDQRKFGEAGINLTQVLDGIGHPCGVFASTWMHSRASSASDSAQLKDFVAPEPFRVLACKATPRLTSSASGTVSRRGRGAHRLRRRAVLRSSLEIFDTATLSNGDQPTGTMTFKLYGPGDATCSGTPVFTSTKTVNGNGSYRSDSFSPTAVGTYRWVVTYSGDDDNRAAGPTTCGLDSETVAIAKANPSLVSTASGSLQRGGRGAPLQHVVRGTQAIHDTATLDGGIAPTGTMTFRLYGPDNDDCSGDAVFTSEVPVDGNGQYTSAEFTPTAAGTYRWRVTYSGDDNNNQAGPTACGIPSETVVIERAQPKIATVATGLADVGDRITDSASLTNGSDPTGTITFKVYPPGDPGCSGTPADTSTVRVRGNGTYTSAPFTATERGRYRWVAAYSGDGFNAAVATSCNDPGESSLIAPPPPVQPALTTTASPPAPAGSPITDTAHLAGGADPTGTITFKVYGPDDPTCAEPAAGLSTVAVTAGNGDYASQPFTPTAAGTYRWVAEYSGDENNKGAGPTACEDAAESVVVSKAHPALRTLTRPTIRLPGTVRDIAALSAGSEPTGTITFRLFGPDDATCSGAPVFTAQRTVTGNGFYGSGRFAPTQAGTYRWIATYSGDANNDPAATVCGESRETVVVLQRRPRLATSASPPANLGVGRRVRSAGQPIYDSATLTRGFKPTGMITFTLFGPDDPTCSGTPIFTTATAVSGNGVYNSERFTPTASGTYRWRATYSGDVNNQPAGPTACDDPAEQVRVTVPAAPQISTSASPAVPLGGAVHDTAHLRDGAAPTGTITFRLYGSADEDCSAQPVFTSTVSVAGNGDYVSGSFVPTAPGAYRWVVRYSGDPQNDSAGPTACGADAEIGVVRPPDITPVTPAFSTTASTSPGIGAPIDDTAHLSGGISPFGNITFTLFGPDDATCSGPPVFTTVRAVSGNGDYRSESFVPTRAGTYRWVAEYSGDALNAGSGPSACNASGESVDVGAIGVAGAVAGSGPNAPTRSRSRPSRARRRPPAVTG
jgi:hypothetical protein